MIKFNAGFVEKRNATLIGFGLTDDNLKKLIQGNPINIIGSDVGFTANELNICIFGAKNQKGIQSYIEKIAKHFKMPEDTSIQCFHLDKTLYFFPVIHNKRQLYFVGIDEQGATELKNGCLASFRVRFIEGEGTNIEVLMFFTRSEDIIEEQFFAKGFIDKNTKIIRDKNGR